MLEDEDDRRCEPEPPTPPRSPHDSALLDLFRRALAAQSLVELPSPTCLAALGLNLSI